MSRAEPLSLPAWVGEVDLDVPPADLIVDPRFRGARVLCTRGGRPVAMLDMNLHAGRLPATDLTARLAAVQGAEEEADGDDSDALPSVTVAVCTRNRHVHLAALLEHLRALTDTDARFLVVDNAPSDDRSRHLVAAAARLDPRLDYVCEERAGLSQARNRALREADSEVVAFIDDDVRMRPGWLTAVRSAFARGREAGHPPLA